MRETIEWSAWLIVCVVGFGLFAYCLVDNEAQRKLDAVQRQATGVGRAARQGASS
jgi:hypothetical protein